MRISQSHVVRRPGSLGEDRTGRDSRITSQVILPSRDGNGSCRLPARQATVGILAGTCRPAPSFLVSEQPVR